MVMVVVDSAAVADAVTVLLMMTVHGGEMNLKFQLEEILEKKDQNDQNSTYYQEANRLMKIQVYSGVRLSDGHLIRIPLDAG